MRLKRDISTANAPASSQLEVGELVINTNTGILYSKMSDGTVIKFLGAPVCETANQTVSPVPVPDITFGDTTTFCCGGDALTVYVSNLLVNHRYNCRITDLVDNSTAEISVPSVDLLPTNKSDRTAVFNINIDRSTQRVALLKISVIEIVAVNSIDTEMLRSEKIINISCVNCES